MGRENYTRQRQGRDFPANPKPKKENKRRDFLNRIERLTAEAERNAAPIDGYEPPRETASRERGI